MVGRQLVHWIVFTAFLKGRLRAERLAQMRHLLSGSDAADTRDTATGIINQPLRDQRHILKRMSKQFTHGLGRRANLPYVLVPGELLGRKYILHKVHLQWLQPTAELGGVHAGEVGVDVVTQLRLKANLSPHLFKHLGNRVDVQFLVESRDVSRTFRPGPDARANEPTTAIGAKLDADVAVTLRQTLQHRFARLGRILASDMIVTGAPHRAPCRRVTHTPASPPACP